MRFRFEFLDNGHVVMLHGTSAPSTEDWREYLLRLRDKDLTKVGLLCFTNGGAPDATQRQELNQVIAGRYYARAIVHRSALVRGVVLAVSWFAPGVKAFSPWTWTSAAEHARFHPSDLPNLANQVRRMHASMAERIPWLDGALEQRASVALREGDAAPLAGADGPVNRPSVATTPAQLDVLKDR